MGNSSLGSLRTAEEDEALPPFLPLKGMTESQEFLDEVQEGYINISTTRNNAVEREKQVDCYIKKRRKLQFLLEKDKECKKSYDLRKEENVSEEAMLGKEDVKKVQESLGLPSWVFETCDIIQGMLGFSHGENFCISNLFFCQRALCYAIKLQQTGLEETKNVVKTREFCDTMDSFVTLEEKYIKNDKELSDLETYDKSETPKTQQNTRETLQTSVSSLKLDPLSCEEKRTLVTYENPGSVSEKKAEQSSTSIPFLKNNKNTTSSTTTIALSRVYIKNYRRPFKKESQVLSDVVRRFGAIQASVTWQLQPNLLTYFKMTTPLYKLPSMMRLWMHKTMYDRCCFTLKLRFYEKQWLIFQMLCAVAQQHCIGVYHGNISLHNFVCTETDHVFLVDIASCYKPYTIPAPYSAFATVHTFYETPESEPFLSSGLRKACYLSPERFCFEPENELIQGQTAQQVEKEPWISPGFPILCAADIYSTGCCIAEVFNEGEPTLTFSDVLSLARHLNQNQLINDQHVFPSDTMLQRVLPSRSASCPWYIPQCCFSNLKDQRVKDLVVWMCHPSAEKRPTATECLIKGRDMSLFPESFFSFLLPVTTLLLHPLLQSNHVVSFFLKKTLKCFKGDSETSTEKDASDPLSDSSDGDPMTFYQHVALTLHELPCWSISSTTNDAYHQVAQANKRKTERLAENLPFVKKLSCEENERTQPSGNLHTNDLQGIDTHHELVTETGHIENGLGKGISIAKNSLYSSLNHKLREASGRDDSVSFVSSCNEQIQESFSNETEDENILNHVKFMHQLCFVQENQNSYARAFFLDFMMYWKCHFYGGSFLESSFLKKKSVKRNWMRHVPLPRLTWETGVIFSSKILKLWEKGYTLHCQQVNGQVDVWCLGENQWGTFHYPNLQILQHLHESLQDVYSCFFVQHASTRNPGVSKGSRCLQLSCHMYLLKLFLFKLTVKNLTCQVQLNYLNCLLVLMKMQAFPHNVHHERILPTLQKHMTLKHCLVIKKYLAVLTQSLQQCSVKQISTDFVLTFMFPLFLQLLETQRVVMRTILLTFLPSTFRILACIFSSNRLSEHAELQSVRLQSLQFFRSLLLYDYEEVQLALLRSTQAFSCIFSIHELSSIVLPFLISFMNSCHATVRIAFCLCIFSIVQFSVTHFHTNRSEVFFQQSSNDFWSIISPLFPCFESALEDSDELVIEAALEGLLDALQTSLTTWLQLVYTTHDPSPFLMLHEKQRWKLVGYQFIQKMVPLLYHPNRSLARTCCHVFDKICIVFFRQDPVDKIVFFDSVLLKNSLLPIKLNSSTSWHHNTAVSRKLLYFLAYRYHVAGCKKTCFDPLMLKFMTPFEHFVSQALRPMTLNTFGLLHNSLFDKNKKTKNCRLSLKHYHLNSLQISQAFPYRTLSDENTRLMDFSLSFSTESVYASLLDCLLMDWFLYNIVSLNQLEMTPNITAPTFYIPKVYKPSLSFYSEQAAIKSWMYRDWRCLCFQLPYFGAGSLVHEITLPHSLVSCTQPTDNVLEMSQCMHLKKKTFYLKLHPCFKCRQQQGMNQNTSVTLPKSKRYVFLKSLTEGEAPQGSCSHENDSLSATFILDSGDGKNQVNYWYFEARQNVQACCKTQNATMMEGETEGKYSVCDTKRYCTDKQWEPTGTLLATCFVADKNDRTNRDTVHKRIGNVHLQLTSDCQLLVAGVENYTYNTRTCSINPYYDTQITVYDTSRLLTQGNEARVDQLHCSKNMIPSCFTLIVMPSSILVGTHDGSLATYSLECQKYSWQTMNNNVSKMSLQLTHDTVSNGSVCALTCLQSSFQMVSLAGHKNGTVSSWDFRCPNASSVYHVPPWIGYPTKIIPLPQDTFCFTTSKGYLITVDSRYNVILSVLQTSLNHQRCSLHSLCSITKFRAYGVAVALQAPRNDVYCLNPLTGQIDWGFLGHQDSLSNHPACHAQQDDCVTRTTPIDSLSTDYTSVFKGSQSSITEDTSLLLPQFQLIDAKHLFSSTMSSRLGSSEMFESHAFHSQNKKQCLWTPDATDRFNKLHSRVFSNDFIVAAGSDPALRFLSLTESTKKSYIIVTPYSRKKALYVPLSPIKSASLGGSLSLASKSFSKYILEKMFSCNSQFSQNDTGFTICSSFQTPDEFSCARKNHSYPNFFSKSQPESFNTIVPWDAADVRQLLNNHKDDVTSVTVAPYFKEVHMETALDTASPKSLSSCHDNGSLLFTGSRDGTIKVWR